MDKDQIHFYKKDGTHIKSVELPQMTYHSDRMKIAEDNGIKDWNHYTMKDTNSGMMNSEKSEWYEIVNGKIIGSISSIHKE